MIQGEEVVEVVDSKISHNMIQIDNLNNIEMTEGLVKTKEEEDLIIKDLIEFFTLEL